ncbi:hypothetical protein O7626_24885 [Micromonospora sp. WMMD1102]|uniref:hypothetical protein n=1 Tax=Micromonospora sp. WMMD1102 TaxID=3016105 RepID=UPI002415719D|nr:hypothetical protein [Micromonospora sp. WMMD1102]MDG4789129.1 hypothetical protein [Micromonospora sp. WMMD1102]
MSDLIARMFRIRYTLRARRTSCTGWLVGAGPRRRAVERDEAAITTWREETWPAGKR